MGDPAPPAWMAAAARKWLEDAGAIGEDSPGAGAAHGRKAFNALPLFGVRVSLAERGRAVCSLRVPAHLTDADGNWHAGAIAAAVDDVCAAAIMSVEGIIKVSVHYDISYFAPAKQHDSDGTWHAGALAAAVDNMCSAVVFTVVGAPTATVHYGLSYFSPVACNEEVQLDGRVVGRKGKLAAAVVQVRKMGSGELVAVGRQWMTPAWPTKSNKSRSKL